MASIRARALLFASFLALAASGVALAGEISPEEMERIKEALRGKEMPSVLPAPESHPDPHPNGKKPEAPKANRTDPPAPTGKEALSAFERYVRGESLARVSTELKQFGYEMFRGRPERFAPVTNVAAGPDYVMGPGDEVILRIWGKVELDAAATVDRGGKLALPKIGVMPVAGKTLAELREAVKARYDKVFNDYKLDVSLGALRTIGVLVVGSVRQPGRHSLSSVATVLNALMAAGGPTRTGSLRSVKLKRNGKTAATLDVYALLTSGERTGDVRLQPEDTVFVPTTGKRVAIAGSVRRPAIYELKAADMNLAAALKLAGGLEPNADRERVQVERVGGEGAISLEEVDLGKLAAGKGFALRDGDVIRVFSVLRKPVNVVYLAGNVARPGAYRLAKDMRVSGLIRDLKMLVPEEAWKAARPPAPLDPRTGLPPVPEEDAEGTAIGKPPLAGKRPALNRPKSPSGPEDDAGEIGEEQEERRTETVFPEPYWDYALIRRVTRPRMEVEYIPFNLGQALLAGTPADDPQLQPADTVIVFSRWDFVRRPMANVGGAVNRVGSYPLTRNMTVRDLVGIAGGLKPYAFRGQAELLRVHYEESGQREERLLIDLGAALAGKAEHNLKLQERDHLFVRSVPEHRAAETVTLRGEVRFPGVYPLRRGERLSSLIERAGGYTERAYLNGAVFTRESVRQVQQERIKQMLTRLETELSRSAAAAAQTATDEDARKAAGEQAAWQLKLLGRLRAVKAQGRVVIRLAALDKFKESEFDIPLEIGDVLEIPRRTDTVNVLGTVHNQNAFLWKKSATYKHYLRLAGGPTRFADAKGVYVIRADGSVVSLRQGRGGLNWDPRHRRWRSGGLGAMALMPGDTVIVPEELERVAWLRNTKDISQILYQIAVATGVVVMAF